MWRLINLAAFLALVTLAAASATEAKSDIREICARLQLRMSPTYAVYNDAEAALKEAKRHLKSFLNLGLDSQAKLLKAWEVVIGNGPCNKQSGEYVAIIYECNPDDRHELATLFRAARDYSNRCLSADQLEDKLQKFLANGDKSGLSKFLNADFLDQYRKENPNERSPQFSARGSSICCQPNQSHKALLKVLAPILGDASAVRANRAKLEGVLQKHLFKPCESYRKAWRPLMSQAGGAAKYSSEGEDEFISKLSPKFKEQLFLYKYCANFLYLDGAKDKLDVIGFFQF